LRKLRTMRKSLPKRDQLLLRIGAASKEAGRAFGFVKIQMPSKDQEVTRETFSFQVDKVKLKASQQRDGYYLLRSNLTGEDPAVLWTRYVQLTQIESVFRSLKSELGVRPIYHQLEHRADAHILIAFLAYCLQVVSALSGVPRSGSPHTAEESSGRGTFDRGDLKEAAGGAGRAMEPLVCV
jgi:Transposase DDE domain